MAQPPFQSDAFKVVGDSGIGTRLLEDNLADGSLKLTDARFTTGILLYELAGLQQLGNVIVCGKTGEGRSKDVDGDPIDTVQKAVDAIPFTADATTPWVIFVGPGVYNEEVVCDKDGVEMIGIGNVVIKNVTASTNTFTLVEGPFSVPRRFTMRNIRIENTEVTDSCVEITSATFATGTVTVAVVPFVGDTLTIAAVVLTAISNGSTPVAGEFELGTDTATTATNIETAINDPLNVLTATVKAFVTGSVVTLRAVAIGTPGNGITMATSVPATLVLSGAVTAGGLDIQPGSTVGNDRIAFYDCDLIPTGATGFYVRAQAVNNLYVQGGDYTGSSTGATMDCREMARVELVGIGNMSRIELRYDDTLVDLPSIVTSTYTLRDLTVNDDHTTTITGTGSLETSGCEYDVASITTFSAGTIGPATWLGSNERYGDVRVIGGATGTLSNCRIGALTVDTVGVATLDNCSRTSLAGDGTGSLSDTQFTGTLSFVAAAAAIFTFTVPQPDALYTVQIESPLIPVALTDIPAVTAKTTTDFTVSFGGAQTLTLGFAVLR